MFIQKQNSTVDLFESMKFLEKEKTKSEHYDVLDSYELNMTIRRGFQGRARGQSHGRQGY